MLAALRCALATGRSAQRDAPSEPSGEIVDAGRHPPRRQPVRRMRACRCPDGLVWLTNDSRSGLRIARRETRRHACATTSKVFRLRCGSMDRTRTAMTSSTTNGPDSTRAQRSALLDLHPNTLNFLPITCDPLGLRRGRQDRLLQAESASALVGRRARHRRRLSVQSRTADLRAHGLPVRPELLHVDHRRSAEARRLHDLR